MQERKRTDKSVILLARIADETQRENGWRRQRRCMAGERLRGCVLHRGVLSLFWQIWSRFPNVRPRPGTFRWVWGGTILSAGDYFIIISNVRVVQVLSAFAGTIKTLQFPSTPHSSPHTAAPPSVVSVNGVFLERPCGNRHI